MIATAISKAVLGLFPNRSISPTLAPRMRLGRRCRKSYLSRSRTTSKRPNKGMFMRPPTRTRGICTVSMALKARAERLKLQGPMYTISYRLANDGTISMSRLCHVHPRYWNVVVSVRWVRWYQEETNYQTGDE